MNGRGLLLLWNDIDAAVEPEYNRWHSREHVPERLTVPGILAARRYAAIDEVATPACGAALDSGLAGDNSTPRQGGLPRYFTVYELASTAVLSSDPYLHLIRSPSPWSARMRPHFANVIRFACHRMDSAGAGAGAVMAVVRVDDEPSGSSEPSRSPGSPRTSGTSRPSAPPGVTAAALAADGIVAAHWCEVDPDVPPLPWQPKDEERAAYPSSRSPAHALPRASAQASTTSSAHNSDHMPDQISDHASSHAATHAAANTPPRTRLLLAEATDIATLRAAQSRLAAIASHAAHSDATVRTSAYTLLHALTKD